MGDDLEQMARDFDELRTCLFQSTAEFVNPDNAALLERIGNDTYANASNALRFSVSIMEKTIDACARLKASEINSKPGAA